MFAQNDGAASAPSGVPHAPGRGQVPTVFRLDASAGFSRPPFPAHPALSPGPAARSAAPGRKSPLFGRLVSVMLPHRALVPCASLLAGWAQGGWAQPGSILFGLLSIAALYASQAVYNNLADRAGDRINSPTRALAERSMTPREARFLMAGLLALGALFGVLGGPVTALAVPVYVFLGAAYSSFTKGRWYLSYPTLAATHHLLPFACGFLAGAPAAALPVPALFFIFLTTVLAISLKDYKDVAGDRSVGLRTLPLAFGTERAAWLTSLGLAAPLALILPFAWAWHWPAGLVFFYLLAGAARLRLAACLRTNPSPENARGLLINFRNLSTLEMLSWCVPWPF